MAKQKKSLTEGADMIIDLDQLSQEDQSKRLAQELKAKQAEDAKQMAELESKQEKAKEAPKSNSKPNSKPRAKKKVKEDVFALLPDAGDRINKTVPLNEKVYKAAQIIKLVKDVAYYDWINGVMLEWIETNKETLDDIKREALS